MTANRSASWGEEAQGRRERTTNVFCEWITIKTPKKGEREKPFARNKVFLKKGACGHLSGAFDENTPLGWWVRSDVWRDAQA